MTSWRASPKANELRAYIDKVLKPRKSTIENLDREIIVDFIANEVAKGEQAGRALMKYDVLAALPRALTPQQSLFRDRAWKAIRALK